MVCAAFMNPQSPCLSFGVIVPVNQNSEGRHDPYLSKVWQLPESLEPPSKGEAMEEIVKNVLSHCTFVQNKVFQAASTPGCGPEPVRGKGPAPVSDVGSSLAASQRAFSHTLRSFTNEHTL